MVGGDHLGSHLYLLSPTEAGLWSGRSPAPSKSAPANSRERLSRPGPFTQTLRKGSARVPHMGQLLALHPHLFLNPRNKRGDREERPFHRPSRGICSPFPSQHTQRRGARTEQRQLNPVAPPRPTQTWSGPALPHGKGELEAETRGGCSLDCFALLQLSTLNAALITLLSNARKLPLASSNLTGSLKGSGRDHFNPSM